MTADELDVPTAVDGPSRRRALGMAGAAAASVVLGAAALSAGPATAAAPSAQPAAAPEAEPAARRATGDHGAECLADLNA